MLKSTMYRKIIFITTVALCSFCNEIAYCAMVGNYNIGLLSLDYIVDNSERARQITKELKKLSTTLASRDFESKRTEVINSFLHQAKDFVYAFAKDNKYDLILNYAAFNKLKNGKSLSKEEIPYYNDGTIQEILRFLSSPQGRSTLASSNIENISAVVTTGFDGKKAAQATTHSKQHSNETQPNKIPSTTKSIALPITIKDVENIDIEFFGEHMVFNNSEYSNGKEAYESAYGSIVNIALGDLNNDEIQDAAFIVCLDGGGSPAMNYYLFAVSGATGKIIVSKHMSLGDRIKVLSLKIKNDKIYWKAKVHNGFSGMALPPEDLVSVVFKVNNDRIVVDKAR